MSFLYTINGLYPNRNFTFTLTAAGLGIAPKEHLHAIGDIHGLSRELAAKSALNHTHVALPAINVGSARLTGPVTLASGNGASVSRTGNTITIGVSPVSTGVAAGFRNANPARRHSLLLFFAGDKRSASGDAEIFIFTEDGNAASS